MNSVRCAIALAFFHTLTLLMVRSFLSIAAADAGADELQIGITTAAYSIIQVVLALPVGHLLHKRGARLPATTGAVAFIFGAFGLVFAGHWLWVAVCATLLGSGHLLITLSTQGVMIGGEQEGRRDRNVGLLFFAVSGGQFLGPVVGGYLLDAWENWGFAAAAVVGLAALCLALNMPGAPAADPARQQHHRLFGKDSDALALLRDKRVVWTILIGSLVMFCQETLITYFPLYAKEQGLNAAAIGAVASVRGVAMMIIRPCLDPLHRRLGYRRLLICCQLFGGVSIIAYALFSGYSALLVVAGLSGLFIGLSMPLSLVLVAENTRPEQRSEAISLRMMAVYAGQSISPLLFGALSIVLGLAPVFWISGALMAAFTLAVKKVTNQPADSSAA